MQHVYGMLSMVICVLLGLAFHNTSQTEWKLSAGEEPKPPRARSIPEYARVLCLPGCVLMCYGANVSVEAYADVIGYIGSPFALLCFYAIWLTGWRAGWNHERKARNG